jgi:hypothetical protein
MRRLLAIWQQLAPLQRQLCLFFLDATILLNLLLAALPWTRNHITALHHTAGFLTGYTSDDSWGPMGVAFSAFRRAPDIPLYDAVFFEQHTKFIYPPSSLLTFWALERLGLGDAMGKHLLTVVSWLTVVLTAVLVSLIFQRSIQAPLAPSTDNRWNRMVTVLLPVAFTLTFYPITRAFTLGQIQTWLTCMAVGLVWMWMQGAVGTAGVLAGLLCLVKPQYLLLLGWGAVRQEWRFTAAGLIALFIGTMASLSVFGWANHIDYFRVLSYIAQHGESYFANQSANGLLHRIFADSSATDFEHQYAAYDPWVCAGTMLSSAIMIGLAFFWRRAEHQRASTTDLLIIMLTLTMASPVAWEHHYGPQIATYAVILPALLCYPVLGTATLRYLALSYILVSNLFRITDYTASTWFNVLQSHEYLGAVMVVVCLYKLRHAEAGVAEARAGH